MKSKTKSKFIKVVINTCHGGFSLSPKAIQKIAERKGEKCYFLKSTWENGESKYSIIDGYPTGLFWTASSTDNIEEFDYEKHNIPSRPKDRTDPDLVSVVEELGEDANGAYSELKVVKIPSDIKWHIGEYDGAEWVAEDHRTWS
jgi:hypothetical protein